MASVAAREWRPRRSTPWPAASSTSAGYGEHFIHRTGHGIGIEEHEDPYLVAGNRTPLVTGHAFSVEPGIYFPGRFGMRLEDIVVVGESGPDPLEHRRPRPRRGGRVTVGRRRPGRIVRKD